jgi:hypothetical protein
MIAETLAGIALVKSAVDGIKSAIGTAKDIGEIAGYVDHLFEGEKQIQQQRAKKSGVSLGDQFGIKSVAQEVIDAKLAQEKMAEMKQLIDMRFGHGTWQGIIDERAKRIQEAKEAELKRKREARIAHEEMMHNIKVTSIVSIIIGALIGLLFLAIVLFPRAAY